MEREVLARRQTEALGPFGNSALARFVFRYQPKCRPKVERNRRFWLVVECGAELPNGPSVFSPSWSTSSSFSNQPSTLSLQPEGMFYANAIQLAVDLLNFIFLLSLRPTEVGHDAEVPVLRLSHTLRSSSTPVPEEPP